MPRSILRQARQSFIWPQEPRISSPSMTMGQRSAVRSSTPSRRAAFASGLMRGACIQCAPTSTPAMPTDVESGGPAADALARLDMHDGEAAVREGKSCRQARRPGSHDHDISFGHLELLRRGAGARWSGALRPPSRGRTARPGGSGKDRSALPLRQSRRVMPSPWSVRPSRTAASETMLSLFSISTWSRVSSGFGSMRGSSLDLGDPERDRDQRPLAIGLGQDELEDFLEALHGGTTSS